MIATSKNTPAFLSVINKIIPNKESFLEDLNYFLIKSIAGCISI
jgi:hypothetical protein